MAKHSKRKPSIDNVLTQGCEHDVDAHQKSLLYKATKDKLNLLPLLSCAFAGSLGSGSVYSQSNDVFALEEIIVTSQRRQESQMDVPIAIGAFTPDDIERTGALSIVDMHHYIPGLRIDEHQATQTEVSIRGITANNISAGGDPSVATFYDGAYVPRAATTTAFADLERVEVLKGPQGTLFGRNAALGVVNIIPNRPNEKTEGFVSAKIGNFGLQRFEGMVNIPASDTVFTRFNVLTNERDGFADNIGPSGGDPGGQDSINARAAMLWQISKDTNFQLSYDWEKVDQAPPQSYGVSPFALNTDPFSDTVANDVVDGAETRDMYSVNAKLNHRYNDQWSMNYLINYREFEVRNRADQDGTADITRYLDTDNVEDSDILYTELQFNYIHDALDVVFGANYSQENILQDVPVNLRTDSLVRNVTDGVKADGGLRAAIAGGAGGSEGDGGIGDIVLGMLDGIDHLWNPTDWGTFTTLLGVGPLGQSDPEYAAVAAALGEPLVFGPSFAGQIYNETSTSTGDFINWGVYFDIDYAIADRFDLAVGIRYSEDEKDFTWNTPLSEFSRNNPALGISNNVLLAQQELLSASESWSRTTGRLVASYHVNEDVLTYASFSTGYKSGGFDTLDVRTAQFPFEPEVVNNYELGIKGDFFEDHIRAQLSLYQFDIDGLQRSVNSRQPDETAALIRVINGDSESNGAEVTIDWVVNDDLLLGLVTSYSDIDESFPEFFNALGELSPPETRTAKAKFNEAFTARLDWKPNIAVGEFLVHVDYIYGKNNAQLLPNHMDIFNDIEGYLNDRKRLNLRLAWTSDDNHWEAAAWGKNLLDENYISRVETVSFDAFGTLFVRIEDPRSYGVDLKYRF